MTPLFADSVAFAQLVDDLLAPFARADFDLVAGIDALGFVLGAAIASSSNSGFIPIRKGGRLPGASRSVTLRDYTGNEKSLSIRRGALNVGVRILIVDDWIETGAQMAAAIELIHSEGGKIAGVAAINIDENEATAKLMRAYRCHSVWSCDAASDA